MSSATPTTHIKPLDHRRTIPTTSHPRQPTPLPDIDPSETLTNLSKSLSTLEKSFEPLLSHLEGWDGLVSGLSTLERAKMEIMVGYAINDLIWMYLKTRGVDPAEHDVTNELERIRTYYAKIRAVEEPDAQRSSTIDKAAAGRFIKASIPSSQRVSSTNGDEPTTSAAALARKQAKQAVEEQYEDVGMSSRFKHIQSGTEKIISQSDDMVVDEGGEELIIDSEEGETPMEAEKQDDIEASAEEAEAFLKSLEDDLALRSEGSKDSEEPEATGEDMVRTDSGGSGKRKRAADMM